MKDRIDEIRQLMDLEINEASVPNKYYEDIIENLRKASKSLGQVDWFFNKFERDASGSRKYRTEQKQVAKMKTEVDRLLKAIIVDAKLDKGK